LKFVLKLRSEQLRSAVRDTEKLTATKVSGRAGAGHLMINMIRTLSDEVDTLQPASAAAVAASVVNVLVAGLQSLPACSGVEPSLLTAYHVARFKRLVDERLRASPGASTMPPTSAARFAGASGARRASGGGKGGKPKLT